MESLSISLIFALLLLASVLISSFVFLLKYKSKSDNILPRIKEFNTEISKNRKRYIANSKMNSLVDNYSSYYKEIRLLPNWFIKRNPELVQFKEIYKDFNTWVKNHNEAFIEEELKECSVFLSNIDGKALDRQQQEVVVIDEDNTLVLAGAGSGKTLTISAKVKYLVERLGVNPDEILLISFTAKSAAEMNERIQGKLKIPIEAMTFHKLGLQIITRASRERPEILNDLLAVINQYFKENVLKNHKLIHNIIHFYSFYLTMPKDIENFETLGDYHHDQSTVNLETLRSKMEKQKSELGSNKMTLRLEQVKSLEEVQIANFLYLNGIDYVYEALYPYQGDKYKKRYRPDFYLPEYNLYLEHFGITESNKAPWLNEIEEKKYVEDMKWKREWHEENDTKLIETYSYYSKDGSLLTKLQEVLVENGVTLQPIDLSQAYTKLFLERKEERQFKEFKSLLSTFITLFKSNGYNEKTFEVLKKDVQKVKNPFYKERTLLFLSMVQPIYEVYQQHLVEKQSIDFNDMINHATSIVEHGDENLLKYQYIIIDEYQDISMNRYRLVKAIKDMTNAKVLCVGDDWQSIFRFAGSDLQLFINFDKYFGFTKTLRIEKTYRNSQELINAAGAFVMSNKRQLKKDLTAAKSNEQPIKIFGYSVDVMRAFSLAVEDIAKECGERSHVMIIGRHNLDVKYLFERDVNKNYLYKETEHGIRISSKKYPTVRFEYNTVHRSKGLEADNVIMINLTNHLIGFPNKISDDPLLSLVLTDSDTYSYAEERRLFYVALTRTKNTSYLITPEHNMSVFVEELIKEHHIPFEMVTGEESFLENPNCPVCQTGKMVIMETKSNGRRFIGCKNYPKCTNTYSDVGIITDPVICRTCGGFMVLRKGPRGEFYGCTNYPLCRNSLDKIEHSTRSI